MRALTYSGPLDGESHFGRWVTAVAVIATAALGAIGLGTRVVRASIDPEDRQAVEPSLELTERGDDTDGEAGDREPQDSLPEAVVEPLTPRVIVTLYNVNTLETQTFELPVDGSLEDDEADELAQFFRCKRSGKARRMDSAVLEMLVAVAVEYPDHVIEIVSGYRAPPFASRGSKHRQGKAIDLRVRDVSTARVRDFLWRENHEVGVGWYREQDFVHMDARAGEPDAAWTQNHLNSHYVYEPRWSRRAR